MTRKYFPLCFYVLVSVLCLGKPSSAYPAGSLGGGGATPAVTNESETGSATIDSITPLKIGDKIPDELWDLKFPMVSADTDNVQHLKLGDYRDKLIILDFWATWCSNCFASLNKLNELQKDLADEMLVLAISSEKKERVQPIVEKNNWQFPVMFADEVFSSFFPHRSVPHQVWIKGGEVVSIPEAASLTRENVKSIIEKGYANLEEKFELLNFDRKQTLVDVIEPLQAELLWGGGIISFIPGIRSGINRPTPTSINFFNIAAVEFYKTLYADDFKSYERFNRIKFEVSDSLLQKIVVPEGIYKGDSEKDLDFLRWQTENTYCYSAVFPQGTSGKIINDLVKKDIDNFFGQHLGIVGQVKDINQKCLIIVERGKRPTGAEEFNSADPIPFKEFIRRLLYANRLSELPMINEVNSDKPPLPVIKDFTDLNKVRAHLRANGLDLIEGYRTIKMLVISETDSL